MSVSGSISSYIMPSVHSLCREGRDKMHKIINFSQVETCLWLKFLLFHVCWCDKIPIKVQEIVLSHFFICQSSLGKFVCVKYEVNLDKTFILVFLRNCKKVIFIFNWNVKIKLYNAGKCNLCGVFDVNVNLSQVELFYFCFKFQKHASDWKQE